MSQYRDDRRAARLRIESLEARLAEREAELARAEVELAERDEEIVRLQRGLSLAGGLGPRQMRSMDAAWASRIVGVATGLALAAAGAGVMLVRSSAAPPTVVVLEAPLHADPVAAGGYDWASAPSDPPAAIIAAQRPGKVEIPRQVTPRVWGGRAPHDEARFREALCAQGDSACRERIVRERALEP